MNNTERLKTLKRLKEELRAPSFRESNEARRDCLAQIVPMLNFNELLYDNAMPVADILGRPGFTSSMYEHAFARIDSLVGQAIAELEHSLTPQPMPVPGQASNAATTISISGGNFGVLNTGQLGDVGAIEVHIQALCTAGHPDLAKALSALTEAVKQSGDLRPEQRSEVLDQLNEIARQAALAPERRARPGIVKALLHGVATTLGTAGSLAEVWSTWGAGIKTFFGF